MCLYLLFDSINLSSFYVNRISKESSRFFERNTTNLRFKLIYNILIKSTKFRQIAMTIKNCLFLLHILKLNSVVIIIIIILKFGIESINTNLEYSRFFYANITSLTENKLKNNYLEVVNNNFKKL